MAIILLFDMTAILKGFWLFIVNDDIRGNICIRWVSLYVLLFAILWLFYRISGASRHNKTSNSFILFRTCPILSLFWALVYFFWGFLFSWTFRLITFIDIFVLDNIVSNSNWSALPQNLFFAYCFITISGSSRCFLFWLNSFHIIRWIWLFIIQYFHPYIFIGWLFSLIGFRLLLVIFL